MRKKTSGSSPKTPAQERHEKFVKENGEWNKKVEQSLAKLKKAVRGRSAAI
jgi:hypothetical protein